MKKAIAKKLWRDNFPELIAFVGANSVDDWAYPALKIAFKKGLLTAIQMKKAWTEIKDEGSVRKYRKSFFQLIKKADPDNILRKIKFFDCFKPGKYFECRTGKLIQGNETKIGTVISSIADNIWTDWAALALLPDEPSKFEHQRGAFLNFIQTPLTEDGVLDFANQFGYISNRYTFSEDGYPSHNNDDYIFMIENGMAYDNGQFLGDWFDEITAMKDYFLLWQAIKNQDVTFFEKYVATKDGFFYKFISPTRYDTIHNTFTRLTFLEQRTVHDPEFDNLENRAKYILERAFEESHRISHTKPLLKLRNNKYQIIHESADLLSNMWFEFAQAISNNSEFRQCDTCGKFFTVREVKNSRSDKESCSSTCRGRKWRTKQRAVGEMGQVQDDLVKAN